MKQHNTAPVRPHITIVGPRPVAGAPACTRTEDEAAELMWDHYKDRKALFIVDIRLHRASILAALMAGVSAESAFEPYLKPADVVKPSRRAA